MNETKGAVPSDNLSPPMVVLCDNRWKQQHLVYCSEMPRFLDLSVAVGTEIWKIYSRSCFGFESSVVPWPCYPRTLIVCRRICAVIVA